MNIHYIKLQDNNEIKEFYIKSDSKEIGLEEVYKYYSMEIKEVPKEHPIQTGQIKIIEITTTREDGND